MASGNLTMPRRLCWRGGILSKLLVSALSFAPFISWPPSALRARVSLYYRYFSPGSLTFEVATRCS